MRNLLIIIALWFSSTAFAGLIHYKNNLFFLSGPSSNISIQYPCTGGGEPLVIYSVPIDNTSPISSQGTIYPLYVKDNYSASNLIIGSPVQTATTSTSTLIVQVPNPANYFDNISFSLESSSAGNSFFVNSINLASIHDTMQDQYVVSFQVQADDALVNESILPIQMPPFVEDIGVLVENSVKKVNVNYFAWNQLGKWQSNDPYKIPTYPIAFNFEPQPSDIPNFYDGYGFWICGSDAPPMNKRITQSQRFYLDKSRGIHAVNLKSTSS